MKFTINTEKFKGMIAKSIIGAGENKLIPITQLMSIRYEDGKLILTTTDSTNYLYIIADDVQAEPFDVTVYSEQFAKPISKMTTANVSLEVVNGSLEVIGNGNYTLELPLDENGELIKFPDPVKPYEANARSSTQTVSLSAVKTVLETIKPSLATTLDIPVLTSYYVGDSIIATNKYKIASMDLDLLGEKMLISSAMFDLFDVITDESIKVLMEDDVIIFTASDCIIYGKRADGVKDYPVDAINDLIHRDFKSKCKVKKVDLLDTLDRMSLFVNRYDYDTVMLHFTESGLSITNKSTKSSEVVKYQDDLKHDDFIGAVDINMLTTQIKAYASDMVEIHYGEDMGIKLVDNSIIQLIALKDM